LLKRLDAAVARGALTDLALALDGVGRAVQHWSEAEDSLALRAELEQPLLDLGAEVDARGDLVRDAVGAQVELLELRLGGGEHALVRSEDLLDLVVAWRLAGVVLDLRHLGRGERPALRQLEQPKALASLDDDVQATVGKAVEDLDHPGAGADVAHALVVLEHETELAALVETLTDELPVAGLEDVQRGLLPRKQHEIERKEPDLDHC
jgi:hypothetical protein